MPQSRSDTGRLGEELTAYYLKRSGYEIIKRNYRVKGGEIDVIASKDGIIAFVEVKTRDVNSLESGAEAVRPKKRRLVIRAAQEYMYRNKCGMQPRFDISEVTVKDGKIVKFRYLDNAYDGGEDYTL